jgi:hypothetical protein
MTLFNPATIRILKFDKCRQRTRGFWLGAHPGIERKRPRHPGLAAASIGAP